MMMIPHLRYTRTRPRLRQYLSSSLIAKFGDRVTVKYRARVVGSEQWLFDHFNQQEQDEKGKMTVVDNTVTFVIGRGEVLPGLESMVTGASPGQELIKKILKPQESFGLCDPKLVSIVKTPMTAKIPIGAMIKVTIPTLGLVDARVISKNEERGEVSLDANHPLCGKSMEFHVQLVSVETSVNAQWSGLHREVRVVGDGKNFPKSGDKVLLHYKSSLASTGQEFDSTIRRKQPFTFIVGAGLVIKGLDIAVQKMSLGEVSTIYIPSEFGFGSIGLDPVVPPYSNLIYDVELLAVNQHHHAKLKPALSQTTNNKTTPQ